MYYGFEWWWIFPIACFGLMLLGMILCSRLGRTFCYHFPKDWINTKDSIIKEEQLEENKNKAGDSSPHR
jgi:hypothetical protein